MGSKRKGWVVRRDRKFAGGLPARPLFLHKLENDYGGDGWHNAGGHEPLSATKNPVLAFENEPPGDRQENQQQGIFRL